MLLVLSTATEEESVSKRMIFLAKKALVCFIFMESSASSVGFLRFKLSLLSSCYDLERSWPFLSKWITLYDGLARTLGLAVVVVVDIPNRFRLIWATADKEEEEVDKLEEESGYVRNYCDAKAGFLSKIILDLPLLSYECSDATE